MVPRLMGNSARNKGDALRTLRALNVLVHWPSQSSLNRVALHD
jgi:hypothetical protein